MLQAKLVVVGGEVQSQEVKLKLPAVIGRGKEATLKVPLALISRRHCEIRERDGRLYIRDLGSLNGTFVNNYKITAEQPLLPGELVTVGTITFRAEYQLQPQSQLRPHASAEPAAQRENSAKTEGGGTGTEEAVVFTPLSPSNGKRSTLATPNLIQPSPGRCLFPSRRVNPFNSGSRFRQLANRLLPTNSVPHRQLPLRSSQSLRRRHLPGSRLRRTAFQPETPSLLPHPSPPNSRRKSNSLVRTPVPLTPTGYWMTSLLNVRLKNRFHSVPSMSWQSRDQDPSALLVI